MGRPAQHQLLGSTWSPPDGVQVVLATLKSWKIDLLMYSNLQGRENQHNLVSQWQTADGQV
jgi:hypothetical protein